MLNYVRQDEEFYCLVKLTCGSEIMGKCMVHYDDEINKRVAFIQSPVEVNVFLADRSEGRAIRGVGFTKWMQFSDEEFFIVTEDHVVSMASLSKDMIDIYEKFLVSEIEDNIRDTDINKNTVPATNILGHVGSVEETRKKLEDILNM
jgi:phenolic acid decarboxylase